MGDAGGVRRHVASNPEGRWNSKWTFLKIDLLDVFPKLGRRCRASLAGTVFCIVTSLCIFVDLLCFGVLQVNFASGGIWGDAP